jgi:hypothetical protein
VITHWNINGNNHSFIGQSYIKEPGLSLDIVLTADYHLKSKKLKSLRSPSQQIFTQILVACISSNLLVPSLYKSRLQNFQNDKQRNHHRVDALDIVDMPATLMLILMLI